ncbi:LysM peptidoglycan-binding domain-containing protein [Aquimarina sp. MMG016]|uniref:amino acid ABC transporter substrate-binding protein n=1 Tax=Aquimarina sp. MMG016 TaxID=2822690 RepID=UPI001B39D562|nr:LysM peptidoglycan-binding domain-containing protein [Aquimarina sp. MMG016]MBQ4819046.1 LysM peptidoglycan-binding domain-containing protein [Aquimarina sp. MMG016]
MKKILLLFLFLFIASNFTYAQKYKSHTVLKGENVFRIAKRYNTTPEAIYKINPKAEEGIKEGEILAIPITDNSEYNTHEVQLGDTIYNLSKKYNTTEEALYILNPETINGINIGQVLRVSKIKKTDTSDTNIDTIGQEGKDAVLDSLKVVPTEPKIERFKTHKVKRKETLFSIAKKYNVAIDNIKKYNKRLYSEELKRKDKIRIPIYAEGIVAQQPLDAPVTKVSTITKYRIQPKDTKFNIARRHGITIPALEELNPNLDPSLPIGTEILVPTSVFIPFGEQNVEEGMELYQVPPKETIYNILRVTGISSDSLFKMNPFLIKEGLKEGMVIKVPKTVVDTTALVVDTDKEKIIDLSSKLYNFKSRKIAIMLPFGVDTLQMKSRQNAEEYLKNKTGARVALDFYRGIKMAADSARVQGVTSELYTFDTKKNKNTDYIKKIIAQNSFDEMDVVIGPLFQANVETVVEELKKYETPVFSPISRKESKLYSNFFQTRPTDAMLQDKLISFIEKDSLDKNIIIIVQQGKKHEEVKKKLIAKFPAAKLAKIEEGNYLYEVNLNKVLAKNKPNWVILESSDIAMISNVTALLNAKAESDQITLFTTDKNNAFDDDSIKYEHLSKLHLHYPSINKEFDENEESLTPFVELYKKKYGIVPNKYTVRGFDIMYDILMRLGTADDVYHSASYKGTTQYVENKFNYTKDLLGGYYNKAAYLIKFDDDLKLTVVE